MSSHVSPRFCSERSPGNADTGPQDVPSQEPSRCQDCGSGPSSGSTACPGAVLALRVPSPRGPAHGQASEVPVDCRSPISSVLVKEFLSFAAPDATLQPVCLSHQGFCKVLVLLLSVRRGPRAPVPAGGSSRGSCSLCVSYCLLFS